MKIDSDIHNHYVQMVSEHIQELKLTESKDYFAGLTCLSLNQRSPKYIRLEVDMAFYLPNSERHQMHMNVVNAIKSSRDFMDKHPKQE